MKLTKSEKGIVALACAWYVAELRRGVRVGPRSELYSTVARLVAAERGATRCEGRAAVLAEVERRFEALARCDVVPLRSLPRAVEAARALRVDLTSLLMRANGRSRERTVSASDALEVARDALSSLTRRALGNGGTVSCSSYGYRWTTTRVEAHVDGSDVVIAADRSGSGGSSIRVLASVVKACSFAPALDGEIAVQVSGIWYRIRGGDVVGVAVPMPSDLRSRFGAWEHGIDAAACEGEIALKREVVVHEARRARQDRRDERATRLLARISHAPVGYAEARALGFCHAGISAWAERRGINLALLETLSVPCAWLAADSDASAQRLARETARKIWMASRVRVAA